MPAGLALTAFLPASLAEAAATVNKGDTAWMLVATILVILMTLPGLALFYGGLARSKNVLSIFMQVFICFCMISLLWFAYGYSVAFTNGNAFFGGFSKAFLSGVDITTMAATFSKETYLPELVYVVFQLTFAAITPGPHRRRLRRTHEVLGGAAVPGDLVHLLLSPRRPHGLVVGRPRCLHAERRQHRHRQGHGRRTGCN